MQTVRTRIAPSPTGEDLHIGNVYTALINYAFARKHKGAFLIRIEDTDRTRLIPGSEQKILSSLKWFNLNYDEGPDVGGPFAPYRQSERLDLYKKYARKLVEAGHAYYCFCDSKRLGEMREKQQAEKKPTIYDGKCRDLDKVESEKKSKSGKFVIRLKVPRTGTTVFTDLIRGEVSFENRLVDDQVLLKSDGYPTYHLGVVVDDYQMGITHVIRAEEWISSTPKHILLYNYLGWKLPVFAHGPILRNPDKSKLSKRKNPVWASWYKNEGFLPEALLNYLALMGWSHPEGKEIFPMAEFIKEFDLKDLKPVGPAFDIKKLEWMNGEYIRNTEDKILADKIHEFYKKNYDKSLILKTVPIIKERIKKLSDYLLLCGFLITDPEEFELDLVPHKKLLKEIIDSLAGIDDWKAGNIGGVMQETAKAGGVKNSEFFMVLRVAVTGRKVSPPLNESMELLGKEKTIHRLISHLSK